MKKKKVFAVSTVVVLICLILIPYTYAYVTKQAEAHNYITTGKIEIKLQEQQLNEQGQLEPYENDGQVYPGKQVSKIPTVTNTAGKAAYVRVKVEKVVTLLEGKDANPDLDLIILEGLNTDDWTYVDGYYYYNEVLNPGETTSPLFTGVKFSEEMTSLYECSTVSINICAYATQYDNQNVEHSYQAVGWPED